MVPGRGNSLAASSMARVSSSSSWARAARGASMRTAHSASSWRSACSASPSAAATSAPGPGAGGGSNGCSGIAIVCGIADCGGACGVTAAASCGGAGAAVEVEAPKSCRRVVSSMCGYHTRMVGGRLGRRTRPPRSPRAASRSRVGPRAPKDARPLLTCSLFRHRPAARCLPHLRWARPRAPRGATSAPAARARAHCVRNPASRCLASSSRWTSGMVRGPA